MNWDTTSAPKLDFNEDFYKVLEVESSIDKKDLKRAYYKIVFKYHPDNKEGEAAKALCNKQMMVINNAYTVLKDQDQRAAYDKKRQMGAYGNAAGKSTPSSSASSSYRSSSSSRPEGKSSSSNSGSSSSGGFDENFFNYQRVQEPVESLSDIFGELWGEIRRGGGAGLLEELVDFLEDQVPAGRVQGVSGAYQEDFIDRASGQSRQELDAEILVLRTALNNLSKHLGELSSLRKQEEDKALNVPPSAPKTVDAIEARLKKIEAIRGLSARIAEVEKQTRQLQRQIKTLEMMRDQKASRQTQNYQNSQGRSSSTFTPPPDAAKAKIDKELQQLKRQMGLK